MLRLVRNVKHRLTSSHRCILTIDIDRELATSTSAGQEVVVDINNTILSGTVVNPYGLLEFNPSIILCIRTSVNSIGVANRRTNVAHHPSVLIATLSDDSIVTANGIVRSKETRSGIILANEVAEIVVGANTHENDRRLLITEIDGSTITEVLLHRHSEGVGSLVELTIDVAKAVAVDVPLHVERIAILILYIGGVQRISGREVDLLLLVPGIINENTDETLRVNLLSGSLLGNTVELNSIELAQLQCVICERSLLEMLLRRSTHASCESASYK